MAENHPQIVILLGPPGSGKGTQANRLTEVLDLPHISTGDLFRENMSRDTELGKKAKFYIESGKLVPDEVVLDMLFDRVSKEDAGNGYLLDGFPRTIPQAKAFDEKVDENAEMKVFCIDVDDDIIVRRISGRLTCRNCGKMYNLYFDPPEQPGMCDLCGGELYQRADDKKEVVEERLKVYNNQTAPLIDYYEERGILHHIDGMRDPEIICREILSLFDRG